MADLLTRVAKMIESAEKITKVMNKSSSKVINKSSSDDKHSRSLSLKLEMEKLAKLLREVSQIVSGDFYDRPTRPITDDTEQVLHKARRVLKTISIFTDYSKLQNQLEDAIRNVRWLLHISSHYDYPISRPPIARTVQSRRFLIWEKTAILHSCSLISRSEAAVSLVLLALGRSISQSLLIHHKQMLDWIEERNSKRDQEHVGKLIAEEGGVKPLLKLHKDGNMQAALAIGILGHDSVSAEHMI